MESTKSTTYGAYSPIRRAGDYYYISGQVGINPVTKKASSDVESQLKQVFDNLNSILTGEGLSLDDIVKTTIYLTDMNDFSVVNEIYSDMFSDPKPARATIGVRELPAVAGDIDLRIELEAIAYKRQGGSS